MSNFNHPKANEIDMGKLFGDTSADVLRQIPADHPSHLKSLVISFNTVAFITGQHEDAPLVSSTGENIDSVDVKTPMGTIFAAKSSLDGLVHLSQDKRVLMFTVYRFNG